MAANRMIASALRRVRRRPAGGDPPPAAVQPELDALTPADRQIVELALPHTMTGVARLQALVDAVRYCEARGIVGAFAECGVWRGGSVLAMIATLQELGAAERDVHLYDTFEGMTAPTEHDVSPIDPPALQTWENARQRDDRPWNELFDAASFNEEGVRETVLSTGYAPQRVHLHRGPVEETLPRLAPAQLALLRLDTDWYASTRHELHHLYPLLAPGGVLIVDDYGHWEGARRAVDEYFSEHAAPVLLHRIDYTGRIAVKA